MTTSKFFVTPSHNRAIYSDRSFLLPSYMDAKQAMRNMRAAQDVSSLMVSTNERMLRRHSDINASDVAAVATRCVFTRI